jgi:hypothetical protein
MQKRIADRGILLKVRVVRQELRSEETGRKTEPEQENEATAKEKNKV